VRALPVSSRLRRRRVWFRLGRVGGGASRRSYFLTFITRASGYGVSNRALAGVGMGAMSPSHHVFVAYVKNEEMET
jgi:hypothetical protein